MAVSRSRAALEESVEKPPRRVPAQRSRTRERHIERIVGVATKLFASNGFDNTGMASLCDALDMGRGHLYNLIGTKENLLWLIFDRLTSDLIEEAEQIRQLGAPPPERLRLYMRHLIEYCARRTDEVHMVRVERRALSPEHQRLGKATQRKYQGMWEDALREGNETGDFDVSDPKLLAMGLLGMCNETHVWFHTRGRLGAEQIADAYADAVLAGIQARPRLVKSTSKRAR